MDKKKLAWIGLGNMGLPMARNLHRGGYLVTGYNRTPEKARSLSEEGMSVVSSIREALVDQSIVATMLSDDSSVRSLCDGKDGLFDLLPPKGIHLSFSTLSPSFIEELTKEHERRGQNLISCPVFGRPDRADSATLTIVTAGAPEILSSMEELFKTVGNTVYNVGEDPYKANWVKILGNFTLAGLLETLAESLSLSDRVGVDPKMLVEILDNALYHSPVFRGYGNLMAEKTWEPAGFRMKLGLKDVRLVLKESDRLEVSLPLADLVHSGFISGIHRGYGELDWSALLKVRSDDAGGGEG
jgi:3-hydroxyisobutyrate dehydrogenase-like beta-hydroxyacid dehydrogenase